MTIKTGNRCRRCSHYAMSPAGLASHERAEHPETQTHTVEAYTHRRFHMAGIEWIGHGDGIDRAGDAYEIQRRFNSAPELLGALEEITALVASPSGALFVKIDMINGIALAAIKKGETQWSLIHIS